MIEIVEEDSESLVLRWDPKIGSDWNRYSYGDTGWRIHAALLSEVAGQYDLTEADIGVMQRAQIAARQEKFTVFADWREIDSNYNYLGALWATNDSDTLFLPSDRESIDDATYYISANQVPCVSKVFRGRSNYLRKVWEGKSIVGELDPPAEAVIMTVTAGSMADSFALNLHGSKQEIKRCRTYVDQAIAQVNQVVV